MTQLHFSATAALERSWDCRPPEDERRKATLLDNLHEILLEQRRLLGEAHGAVSTQRQRIIQHRRRIAADYSRWDLGEAIADDLDEARRCCDDACEDLRRLILKFAGHIETLRRRHPEAVSIITADGDESVSPDAEVAR